jgi:hypothetical protein
MTTYTNGITRAEFIAECEAHRAADRYMAGHYWRPEQQRGCAVGCAVQTVNQRLRLSPPIGSNDHAGLARALGWPAWLVHIQDVVFENLPGDQRVNWPVNLAIAVPENVDLGPVLSRINARILREMVLPIAGTSADVVARVANGLETDWVNDDPDAAAAEAEWAAEWAALTAERAADAADAAAWTTIAAIVLEEVARCR